MPAVPAANKLREEAKTSIVTHTSIFDNIMIRSPRQTASGSMKAESVSSKGSLVARKNSSEK
jgi:hypothetical protein